MKNTLPTLPALAPGSRRSLDRSLYAAAFLAQVGLGCLTLGIVFFAKDTFNPAPVTVGWLAATWSITYAVACLGLRPLLNRASPLREIVGAMLALAALTVALRLSPTLPWMFLSYAGFGLALAFFWPSLMGCLSAGRESRELAKTMVRFNLSWCVAAILSPYLCGWMNERQSGSPLWLAAALFMATALLVHHRRRLAPYDATIEQPHSQDVEEAATGNASTPLRFPAWVGIFGTYFGQAIMVAVFPLIGRERYGLTESGVGLLLLIRAATNAAGFLGLGALTFWHFRLKPMIVGQAVGVAGFGLLILTRSPILIGLSMALLGLSAAISYSASIFHGVAGSVNRSRRMAIHEATLSTGLVLGSVLGGAVYGAADYRPVYALSGAVLVASALVQAAQGWRMRRTT